MGRRDLGFAAAALPPAAGTAQPRPDRATRVVGRRARRSSTALDEALGWSGRDVWVIGGADVYRPALPQRRRRRGHRGLARRRRRHPRPRARRGRPGGARTPTRSTAGTCRPRAARGTGSRRTCAPEARIGRTTGVPGAVPWPHAAHLHVRSTVRHRAHRDGHAVHGRRRGRPRRRRPAGRAPGRPRQRRARAQRDDRRVADDDATPRRPSWSGPSSRRSATAPGSSPASAPTTPRTPSGWPSRPPRPARTACSWSPRTTRGPRRRAVRRTSRRSPTRPPCR